MPDKYIEDGKTVKMSDMAIDTGLPAKEVKKLVSVGDSVTIAQSVGELGKKQWSGKSLDDRASVAALINVMCRLSEKQLNADVYAVAAVQEEVGCRGGKTTAGGIRPDIAIAIDVTHGITPDNSDNAFEVGSGTAISVGPNIHPLLADALFKTADTHNIKYTIEACGGETGTDAWEIQPSRGGGVPTALLSIPLKYMHTSVETLAVSDVKATAKLLAAFIEEFTDLNAFDFAKEVLK
jgi:endoglucanase